MVELESLKVTMENEVLCRQVNLGPCGESLVLTRSGFDLSGNTFWEFKDSLNANNYRMRRIVEYPRSTQLSDVKVSPQWHQWLKHTRKNPPSITEQSQDLVRQERLKVLAAEADARWAAKPSFLDKPGQQRGQPLPAIGVKDPGGYAPPTEPPEKQGVRNAIGGGLEDNVQGTNTKMKDLLEPEDRQSPDTTGASKQKSPPPEAKVYKEDPWKKARGGPSEEWVPQAWDPNAGKGR